MDLVIRPYAQKLAALTGNTKGHIVLGGVRPLPTRRSPGMEIQPSPFCSFACIHCQGIDSWGAWPGRFEFKGLETKDIRTLFAAYDKRKKPEFKLNLVTIGGNTGDPLFTKRARNVTRAILEETEKRGIPVGILTNASFLTSYYATSLARREMDGDFVRLSIDSPVTEPKDPEFDRYSRLYQAVKRPRFGPEKALAVVLKNSQNLLSTAKIRIQINWLLDQQNFTPGQFLHDATKSIKYWGKSGATELRFFFPNNFNSIARITEKEMLDEIFSAFRDIFLNYTKIAGDFVGSNPNFSVIVFNTWQEKTGLPCQTSVSPTLGPDGRFYYCYYLAAPGYPGVALDFHRLWDSWQEYPKLFGQVDVKKYRPCQIICDTKSIL